MLFSDLLADPEPVLAVAAAAAARRARRDRVPHPRRGRGDVSVRRAGRASKSRRRSEQIEVDADGYRRDYLDGDRRVPRRRTAASAAKAGIDYVPLDTSMPFDRALMEYLVNRRNWG